ncbi:hypothetical protein TNCV_2629021 [Trichonephila clavipes]|uniref:Uncharacterized protein n=1 Tax=Trichonephila clavipes TaxID=2585209 RepID=A0A8X6VJQ8_TRICX|nr:hypothetical protein TNCV_2629021 [Trichonephila clavipes]
MMVTAPFPWRVHDRRDSLVRRRVFFSFVCPQIYFFPFKSLIGEFRKCPVVTFAFPFQFNPLEFSFGFLARRILYQEFHRRLLVKGHDFEPQSSDGEDNEHNLGYAG